MTITSNTIVKNGMPFIGVVLEQVAPYMDEMIITISKESSDGTLDVLLQLKEKYESKVFINLESVKEPGELTEIRNQQKQNSKGDWILFLDDDDYWPRDQLKLCMLDIEKDELINAGFLAYSVSPYQLIDFEHYDTSWNGKSFSKWLKNTPGLQYIKPWPRDLPANEGVPLYWKTHPKVKTLPYRFYHLSYLKSGSFRNEEWAKVFSHKIGKPERLTKPVVL